MADLRPGQVGSVTDLALAMEVNRSTAHGWLKKPGFPQAVDGVFTVRLVCEWKFKRDLELEQKNNPPPAPVDPDDPLLGSGDSPGLERYRMAKAQLAEMDLAEREKVTLSADAVHDGLNIISQTFRKACEILQRKFGTEAFSVLETAVQEAETQIDDMFRATEDDASSESGDP